MGNSDKAYHLASDFPYFLTEEFPNLRFKPKPRTHPKQFFPNDTDASATGTAATYTIFDTTPAFQNAFKEAEGKIFPQAARFRVFAYVYEELERRHPTTVFEVTTEIADITWKVNIANKKSKKTTAPAIDPHENLATTSSDLNTSDTSLLCKRLRPVPGLPNLAYIFLERDDTDKGKVTGRLHVIGNEGEFVGSAPPTSLWSDDWYDSAGDGFVQASVKPKGGGAALRALAGASSVADLQYFAYGTGLPQAGSTVEINAVPAWVVVGCPDYVPDMGHFVSLWDVALQRGLDAIEKGEAKFQVGKHKLIREKREFDTYKHTDYRIHIHPHLSLFADVTFVSGEAAGDPEDRPTPPQGRAHNIHPDPDGAPSGPSEGAAVTHGGAFIKARANKADLADPKALKETDSSKPIKTWLKRAIFSRLRLPKTVYKRRKLIIRVPGEGPPGTRRYQEFPRKLGRRMHYDRPPGPASDKDKFYKFPHYRAHEGNLLRYHGLPDKGKLCGQTDKSPPTAGPPGAVPAFTASDIELLQFVDDMFWPASYADMPMLRELAYTDLQYEQFKVWKEPIPDGREEDIVKIMVSPGLEASFAGAGDADKHFADFLAARPLFAPAMIDMAYLGAMLGGSFLPGIEVGREAGIVTNWTLYHGATKYFPSIRFKPSHKDEEHPPGTLTKDLAVPWSEDFKACDELFWPTSRPGKTTVDGVTRHNWQITITDSIPHLPFGPRPAADEVEFVKEYWKALGFIRRESGDKFLEKEQSWH
jgi:hypothetical protein